MALQVFVLCVAPVFCCMLVWFCASLFMQLGPFCYGVASVRMLGSFCYGVASVCIVCGARVFVRGSLEALSCGFLLWVLLHVYRPVISGSLYMLRNMLFKGLCTR